MSTNKQSCGRAASNDRRIPYGEAVAKGKAIIAKLDGEQRRLQMRLGELADKVETKYRERTIAKFAKAIGVAPCTLLRHRSVYRAWDGMGIWAPGPVSYAVLRELQDHPKREAIVKENPKISKREAQRLRFAYEGKQQREGKRRKGKFGDCKNEEKKRWLRRVHILANDILRTTAGVVVTHDMREIVEPELLSVLLESIAAQQSLVDQLEKLRQHDEQIGKAKRKRPEFKEAEREGIVA
jgi:hypothetical protein